MNLIQALVNAIRLPELRNKILFTGGILIIFRFFANVAVPGASQTALANLFNSQALLGLLDLFSGGGLSRFSVVAMGMNPYINATIARPTASPCCSRTPAPPSSRCSTGSSASRSSSC